MLASTQVESSAIPSDVRQLALDRCAFEQAEILNRPDVAEGRVPAWLVTLGVEDWECEKRLLAHVERGASGSTATSGEAKA